MRCRNVCNQYLMNWEERYKGVKIDTFSTENAHPLGLYNSLEIPLIHQDRCTLGDRVGMVKQRGRGSG